jgi:hypothetical protein
MTTDLDPPRSGRIVGIGLFLACAFPYISIVATPFDTQPYAVVAAVIVLTLEFATRGSLRIPHLLAPFGVVLVIAGMSLVAFSDPATGLRSMVGYASVFLISTAAFVSFGRITGRHLMFAVAVWAMVGTIQMTIDKTAGSFLLPRLSTSVTRGVTSLAVEPSYYVVVCIGLMILADVLYARKSLSRRAYLLIFAATVLQILYARAGLGVLLFFVYLAARLASQSTVTQIFKSATVLAVAVGLFVVSFRNVPDLRTSRVGRQLDLVVADPWKLLYSDASVADRLVHVLVSHASAFYHPLGFGPGKWGYVAREMADRMGGLAYDLASLNMSTTDNRVMSGWGGVFFELGLAGFVFIGGFVALMALGWRRADTEHRKVFVSSAITIYVLMLMAVPIAFPLFGYLLGVFVHIAHTSRSAAISR